MPRMPRFLASPPISPPQTEVSVSPPASTTMMSPGRPISSAFRGSTRSPLESWTVIAWPTAFAVKAGLIALCITPVRYCTSAKTQEAL